MRDVKAYMRAYYEAHKEKIKARSKRRREEKPEECRAAVEAWNARPENIERRRQYFKEVHRYSDSFKRAQVTYRQKNKEKISLKDKRWRAENKDKHAAKNKRYYCSVLQRTPSWLTEDEYWLIGEIYALAALRTKMFGFPWHVDHEIPLQGRNVSGLHVPFNLRVIPAAENLRKSYHYAA